MCVFAFFSTLHVNAFYRTLIRKYSLSRSNISFSFFFVLSCWWNFFPFKLLERMCEKMRYLQTALFLFLFLSFSRIYFNTQLNKIWMQNTIRDRTNDIRRPWQVHIIESVHIWILKCVSTFSISKTCVLAFIKSVMYNSYLNFPPVFQCVCTITF